MTRQATFYWLDGTPIDFGTLRFANNAPVPNPAGALGSPLAACPAFRGNVRVRREFSIHDYHLLAQLGVAHQAGSWSSTDRLSLDAQGNSSAYWLPAYTTLDAVIGVSREAWSAQLYADNLSDERAQLYANYWQSYKAVTVNRPRTIGLRVSYGFGGS